MHKMDEKAVAIRRLVYLSLMVALQILLTRLLVIDMGAYRISFGSVATILAGLWLGPVAGGVCGLTADVLGCFLKGFAVNPLITLAAIMWGVIPALLCSKAWGRAKTKAAKTGWLCGSIAITAVVSSLLLTTAGLVLFLGYHLYAILPGRIVQTAIMTPCYCVVTCLIYFSPVTAVISGTFPVTGSVPSR